MTGEYSQRNRLDSLRIAYCDYAVTSDAANLELARQIEIELLPAPDLFDSGHPANVLTQHNKAFAGLCASLTDAGFGNPAALSLFDFHTAIEYLNAKNKKE